VTISAFEDRLGIKSVPCELSVQIRRRVAAWTADRVKGAVGRLELDPFVARRRAAGQRSDSNHRIERIAVAPQTDRILPAAWRAIGRRRVVDDILDDVAAEIDALHTLGAVRLFHFVRVVAVHTFNVFRIRKTRVGRGLSRL
jgi:hypothetical protein